MTLSWQLIEEFKHEFGYQTELLDKGGWLGQIKKGTKCYTIVGNILPINGHVPAWLATDKLFSLRLLKKHGLRVPDTKAYFREDYADYATKLQTEAAARVYFQKFFTRYPQQYLVVKPNKLHSGKGVQIVRSKSMAMFAMREAWKLDYIALVQPYIPYPEYRFIVYRGKVLWNYRKQHCIFQGDGKSSKIQIMREYYSNNGHLLAYTLSKNEGQVVPAQGEMFHVEHFPLNLSLGAQILENGLKASVEWHKVCVQALHSLGLIYGAVDIRIKNIANPTSSYKILEINANPIYTEAWQQGYQKQVRSIHRRLLSNMLKS